MINAIELYGMLVLTVVGFVVPILTILISLFPEGTKSLFSKYENERRQSDENIANEIKKKQTEQGLDYHALQKTLKTLKKKKREAELKLGYLKPTQFLLRTSIPFIVAFTGTIVALLAISLIEIITALTFSLLAFICGLVILFISITVLFEVAEIVSEKKNGNEEKIIELLSTLVAKSGDNLFLREDEVGVIFNDQLLSKDEKIDFSVNKKHEIPISIRNRSEKMAKKVEVGFIFPKDVVIEKTTNFSIYTDGSTQTVRFNLETIQAHENNKQGRLPITFLQAEESKIEVFIKGENVKYQKFPFKLNIVK